MDTDFFHGSKVFLRAFEPEDAPALLAYLNHPDLAGRRYLPWKLPEAFPLSLKQAGEVIDLWAEDKNEVHLAVVARHSGSLVGHCECEWDWDPHNPSIAVVIAPECQRQGYGSEVMHMLLAYLFENSVAHNVSTWVSEWNESGQRFVVKHGFQASGRMRRIGLHQGRYYDSLLFDLLRPEWLAGKGGK